MVNSGGVIQVADEDRRIRHGQGEGEGGSIFDTTPKIFVIADDEGRSTGGRSR